MERRNLDDIDEPTVDLFYDDLTTGVRFKLKVVVKASCMQWEVHGLLCGHCYEVVAVLPNSKLASKKIAFNISSGSAGNEMLPEGVAPLTRRSSVARLPGTQPESEDLLLSAHLGERLLAIWFDVDLDCRIVQGHLVD